MALRGHVSVTALMDLDGRDEVGRPDDTLIRCDCGDVVPIGDSVHPTVCEESDS